MTIQELKREYKKVFYLEDDGVLDILVATVISTFMKREAVWLLIVGASSGGKTELINIFTELAFVYEVDELTESTFLSGMRAGAGKSASLLDEIGPVGCIAMKDFTSILTMRQDKRELILGQMRQIYDGKFNKKTGNGENPNWKGKINFIGGVTDAVYTVGEASADMGRRTINYVLPKQDRQLTASYARRNKKEGNLASKREYLQQITTDFVMQKIDEMPLNLPPLKPEVQRTISLLVDFVTQARTPVKRNFQGKIVLVDDFEMPMRVDEQIQVIAEVMNWLYGGLQPEQEELLYRLCLDSIPKQRRLTLKTLAGYSYATTVGLATKLNYPTDTARVWLEDLNAVEIVRRETTGAGVTKWSILEPYRTYMRKYDNIPHTEFGLVMTEASMEDSGGFSDGDLDPGLLMEMKENMDERADQIFNSLGNGEEF
jgi:hypothetical protein